MLISELSKYSVCCSYDKVRLFRYSAAVHVAQNYDEVGFGVCDRKTENHCIYDNCDAEILSPNCMRCFHCLAMIMAQVRSPSISSPAEAMQIGRTDIKSTSVFYEVVLSVARQQLSNCLFERIWRNVY